MILWFKNKKVKINKRIKSLHVLVQSFKKLKPVMANSVPSADLQKAVFTTGIFKCHSRKSTGVINDILLHPFRFSSSRALVFSKASSPAWFNETLQWNVTIVNVISYTCAFTAMYVIMSSVEMGN